MAGWSPYCYSSTKQHWLLFDAHLNPTFSQAQGRAHSNLTKGTPATATPIAKRPSSAFISDEGRFMSRR
ncbi:hypothetical protein CULC22_00445 [Corynebacterium ulcerans BR-AD22]|nr:hypothetical protein CULC22_00445 [Corynebacterium ulcerans BR-AD22]